MWLVLHIYKTSVFFMVEDLNHNLKFIPSDLNNKRKQIER